MDSRYSLCLVWKSREAFEKSTFFKRLLHQGFLEAEELWPLLGSSALRQERVFRLNPLRGASLDDFQAEGFCIASALDAWPGTYSFNLESNAANAQHPFWGAGLAYVQDVTALSILDDLDVIPGQWILDLCAAPGSKSTRISEMLGPTGWLVSNDSDLKRARLLSGILLRHGAMRSTVFSQPGSQLCKNFPECFDRVLVDAPCSGESLFFKREDKRRDVYESEIQECVVQQNELMEAAAGSVKPGGRLLYSTCTFNFSENEEVTRRFLRNHGNFELVKEVRRWPEIGKGVGGYWAVFSKKGTASESPKQFLRPQGAERHGLLDFEGKVHSYARAMLTDADLQSKDFDLLETLNEPLSDWIVMTHEEARQYLSGEALPNPARKQGHFRVCFLERWPLGPVKGVEGRFNNLLPLELRPQFRSHSH